MLTLKSLSLESILKSLHIFIGNQLKKFIDLLFIELFSDNLHINDLWQIGCFQYFTWKRESFSFIVEIKVGTIDDNILLDIHRMQLEGCSLSEEVDFAL